ncbi:MAG: hypothetical protein RBG13Loki_3469 [Promethearchaeota archaeon CR_4]|nr:MAG: hypothetical protein RBG13Loki_3469 [Candidatus Lokiarchaeota archaeon CR_4]
MKDILVEKLSKMLLKPEQKSQLLVAIQKATEELSRM